MIPVSPRKQIISKLLHGMAISTMGILVIGAFVVGLIGVSVLKLLVLIFLSSLASMTIAILDLIIDIFRPKLDWTNPHEAVKTNLNGLFGIIVSMGYMFFMTVFASAMVLFRMPQTVIFLGIFIFEVVVLLPCIIVLFKVAENRYKNIEI
jgi:ABC-2 type transport system permease protein